MRPVLLEPRGGLSPEIVRRSLALASCDLDADLVNVWTRLELAIVYDWAMREHLNAGDAPVRRRRRPWLVAYAVDRMAEREARRAAMCTWGVEGSRCGLPAVRDGRCARHA